jgi:hypothetical protein
LALSEVFFDFCWKKNAVRLRQSACVFYRDPIHGDDRLAQLQGGD